MTNSPSISTFLGDAHANTGRFDWVTLWRALWSLVRKHSTLFYLGSEIKFDASLLSAREPAAHGLSIEEVFIYVAVSQIESR